MNATQFLDSVKHTPLIEPSVYIEVDGDGAPYLFVGYTMQLFEDNIFDKAKVSVVRVTQGPLGISNLADTRRIMLEEKLPFMASFVRCEGHPDESVIELDEPALEHLGKRFDTVINTLHKIDYKNLIDKEFHRNNPCCVVFYSFIIRGEEGQQLEEFVNLETKELLEWPKEYNFVFITKVIIPDENGKPIEVDPAPYLLPD